MPGSSPDAKMPDMLQNASLHPADGWLVNALRRVKDKLTNRYRKGEPVLQQQDMNRIEAMVASVERGPQISQPSLYWRKLNRMNIEQLRYTGFENFKRTIALNYFTFVNILPWDPQVRTLLANVPTIRVAKFAAQALCAKSAEFYSSVNWLQTRIYTFMTLAMRERLRMLDLPPGLSALPEPQEGGAIPVRFDNGQMISADLCNAMAEYHFAASALSEKPRIVMELGGGYGRTAYVWASMNKCKYVMVDIAPALWVAERYMSTLFKDRRIFKWRSFDSFADVKAEFDQADICFLTPEQLGLLPDGMIDLGMNISSLHEMTLDKITHFIGEFDRLIKNDGCFYLKAWKRSVLPVDNVIIERSDYPIPASWRVVREETPIFQPTFFEAVFSKARA